MVKIDKRFIDLLSAELQLRGRDIKNYAFRLAYSMDSNKYFYCFSQVEGEHPDSGLPLYPIIVRGDKIAVYTKRFATLDDPALGRELDNDNLHDIAVELSASMAQNEPFY